MIQLDFPTHDYKAMLNTRHQAAQMGIASMEPWPVDKAARLMAIVQVWGNNEGFTMSPKFNADREYIQQLYSIYGGVVADNSFIEHLRKWLGRYYDAKSEAAQDFVDAHDWIKQMYNFKLLF